MRPASRLAGLGLSPIRAMNEGAPEGAIPLGLGEPTWELPAAARRALAAGSGPCSYGPNAGLPGLRRAAAAYQGCAEERIMIASGSQGALFALFQAWLEPGDEVLLPNPGFLAYGVLARLAGAIPRPYLLGAGGGLEPELIEAAILAHPRARLLVLNHPSNPTGGGTELAALATLAQSCERRGILLISDEVYRELHLGRPQPSLAEATDYGIVLSSLSKAWGAPGLRIGWAAGDPELLAPARLVHNYMVSCPARPSQEAGIALLEDSPLILPAARAELLARWEALARGLREGLGIEASPPAGGFYYWLRLPPGTELDPLAFCLRVRDQGGVILVPGLAFGEAGRAYVRLSFAARPEAIEEGLRRLAPFWNS